MNLRDHGAVIAIAFASTSLAAICGLWLRRFIPSFFLALIVAPMPVCCWLVFRAAYDGSRGPTRANRRRRPADAFPDPKTHPLWDRDVD